jgi:hypothetical protein
MLIKRAYLGVTYSLIPGSYSMLIHGGMKHKKYTFVKLLLNDGSDGETRSCKVSDLTLDIRSN